MMVSFRLKKVLIARGDAWPTCDWME